MEGNLIGSQYIGGNKLDYYQGMNVIRYEKGVCKDAFLYNLLAHLYLADNDIVLYSFKEDKDIVRAKFLAALCNVKFGCGLDYHKMFFRQIWVKDDIGADPTCYGFVTDFMKHKYTGSDGAIKQFTIMSSLPMEIDILLAAENSITEKIGEHIIVIDGIQNITCGKNAEDKYFCLSDDLKDLVNRYKRTVIYTLEGDVHFPNNESYVTLRNQCCGDSLLIRRGYGSSIEGEGAVYTPISMDCNTMNIISNLTV
jgi:hypothetical protein